MYVMFIGAHPDDAESSAGGTLARWAAAGHHVQMLSATNGDAGHYAEEYIQDRSRLAARRREEALAAAAVIGAEAATLGFHDGEVVADLESTWVMTRAIRGFGPPGLGPDVIITHRPSDYHRDHRYTSRLVLDSAYMLTVPLFCSETPFLHRDPIILYHRDTFTEGGPFRPDLAVDTSDFLVAKARMIAAHASQFFEWLPFNAGEMDQVPATEEEQLKWLLSRVRQRAERAALEARAARLVVPADPSMRCAELFQVSEYGRQPGAGELQSLLLT